MATAVSGRRSALQAYLDAAAGILDAIRIMASSHDVSEMWPGHHTVLIWGADPALASRQTFGCAAGLHLLPLQKDTILCGGSGVDCDTAAAADQAWHDQVRCMCSVEHGPSQHCYIDENGCGKT